MNTIKQRVDNLGPVSLTLGVLVVIAVATVVGFLTSPEWGAIIVALTSALFSCITLGITWSDRNETNRPRVVFYAHREDDDIYFNVVNIGLRPAFNVTIQIDHPVLYRLGNNEDPEYQDIRDIVGFLHVPIAMVAPSQVLKSRNKLHSRDGMPIGETVLQRFLVHENENNPGTVTYQDQNKREYTEEFVLGFAAFENMKLVTNVGSETY